MIQKFLFVFSFILFTCFFGHAQQITGLWEGKINNQKVEVKIIQKGDSLTGTSYYYSGNHFKRYSIKGYFDPYTNEVVWWDDQLISPRNGSAAGHVPHLSRADFNCPGGARMMLDGKSTPEKSSREGKVYLEKIYSNPRFRDEWDYVINNYTIGGNHPDIIDSISMIAFSTVKAPRLPEPPAREEIQPSPEPGMPVVVSSPPITIEEKFTIRKKVFTAEIPLEGDSLELRFFDNVQVDGDSITLFLNDKLIYSHIRLTEKPFIVKIAVDDLQQSNELTMVAENLGAIPPNTAYMLAIVNGKRHEVNLSSTEETSGMIRLVKKQL